MDLVRHIAAESALHKFFDSWKEKGCRMKLLQKQINMLLSCVRLLANRLACRVCASMLALPIQIRWYVVERQCVLFKSPGDAGGSVLLQSSCR